MGSGEGFKRNLDSVRLAWGDDGHQRVVVTNSFVLRMELLQAEATSML